ncbi:MAG: hypothetical protein WBA81_11250, partial [Rhodococcus sp. (in: high G+C Gram-positive bacteria)]
AADAARDERERQLRRLDSLVRPVLVHIAESTQLDEAGTREALLVEATLRDSIRARALDVPDIVSAARSARERGVTVQLLDDGGLGANSGQAVEFRRTVVEQLDAAHSGSITVRVQPPDRNVLATIVVSRGDYTERFEFDAHRIE